MLQVELSVDELRDIRALVLRANGSEPTQLRHNLGLRLTERLMRELPAGASAAEVAARFPRATA